MNAYAAEVAEQIECIHCGAFADPRHTRPCLRCAEDVYSCDECGPDEIDDEDGLDGHRVYSATLCDYCNHMTTKDD